MIVEKFGQRLFDMVRPLSSQVPVENYRQMIRRGLPIWQAVCIKQPDSPYLGYNADLILRKTGCFFWAEYYLVQHVPA